MKHTTTQTVSHIGIVAICLLIALVLNKSAVTDSLERPFYDFASSSTSVEADKQISIIAIDEPSLAALGRWPWSRDKHTALLSQLSKSGAKVIGKTVYFLEPQQDDRLFLVDQILQNEALYNVQALSQQMTNEDLKGAINGELSHFFDGLLALRSQLDVDGELGQVIANNGDVILPFHAVDGKHLGNPEYPLPQVLNDRIINAESTAYHNSEENPAAITDLILPIEPVSNAAAGLGHLAVAADSDGVIRKSKLFVDYYGKPVPSMAVEVVRQALNLEHKDVQFDGQAKVQIGNISLATDRFGQINNVFYPHDRGEAPFEVDSFADVLNGTIAYTKYSGKIVLIGSTAAGIGDTQVTANHANMPPVIALAHTVSNILNEHTIQTPVWADWFIYLGLAIAALFYLLFYQKITPQAGLIFTVTSVVGLLIVQYFLLYQHLAWLSVLPILVFVLMAQSLLSTWRFFYSEKESSQSRAESAESNRMLGLSFQGQGQLDLAFEKLQKCPVDEPLMAVLYNLAVDFERKRQFGKAVAVYQHMAEFDSGFRDVKQRQERAESLENTVILGGSANHTSGPGESLILDAESISNPRLGRYEIEKELGKGAMGIVYLGKDPQIGRIVAIKTMSLLQEFEAENIEQVTERFFREAETAGKLRHPNIVTVYDAGSEHDLAYIAMEFLEGYELSEHATAQKLLPIDKTLKILISLADALSYAHDQQVVHRDIKPANIIYNPKSDHATITDFGIARVVNTSKTKTGTVLGTPSYMAPEQFKSGKVDGRADIFSLGVVCYQLLTGTLPFKGDSLMSLMHAIAEEPFPPPEQYRDDLPDTINEVLYNSLAKSCDERYATAKQMAEDLSVCLSEWQEQKQDV